MWLLPLAAAVEDLPLCRSSLSGHGGEYSGPPRSALKKLGVLTGVFAGSVFEDLG
jgi:hypothetical protein